MKIGSTRGATQASVVQRLVICLFALFFAFASPAAALAQEGSVRATLDLASISIDEAVTMTVIARDDDGSLDTAELDTAALEEEFEIIGRSSSRQVNVLNGQRTAVTSWALELRPRRTGVITVPAVGVGRYESELLTLEVTESATGADRDLFIEASVDKADPWVQAQVILTLRVFKAIEIVDGALSAPRGESLEVELLGDDRNYQRERDGRRYAVTERRFVLSPQRSGKTTIAPVTLEVSVPADPSRVRGFFSPTRRLTRHTAPIELDVKPRPAGGGSWWLPASALEIDAGWNGDVTEARVDQPLVRTVVLRATGALASQIPDLDTPSIDGAAVYADDAERVDGAGSAGVLGELRLTWAIIPQRTGRLSVPETRIDWFDTGSGEFRTAVLAAETLEVGPAAGAGPSKAAGSAALGAGAGLGSAIDPSSPGTIDDVSGASAPVDTAGVQTRAAGIPPLDELRSVTPGGGIDWRLVALAALAGWLLTAAALLRQILARRTTSPDERSNSLTRAIGIREARRSGRRSAARAVLEVACRDSDPRRMARAVLDYADAASPARAPPNLRALAERLDDATLRAALERLDETLYRNASDRSAPEPTIWRDLPEMLADALARESDRVEGGDGTDATSSVRSSVSPGKLPSL